MKFVPGPGREALGVALGTEEQQGGEQEHSQQQREEEHLLIRSVWRVTETVISVHHNKYLQCGR